MNRDSTKAIIFFSTAKGGFEKRKTEEIRKELEKDRQKE
jgi:hypothetical protein